MTSSCEFSPGSIIGFMSMTTSWHGNAWWRHQMEIFSALLALCARNSPVPVNSPHKGQWRGALMFSMICAWINDWISNREAGDLKRHRGQYDVNVMDFHIIGTLSGSTSDDRWITLPKSQLCRGMMFSLFFFLSEQALDQISKFPVIREAMTPYVSRGGWLGCSNTTNTRIIRGFFFGGGGGGGGAVKSCD